jgi:FtsP/CotA-like multicopper oxidase with cupredoxin domain
MELRQGERVRLRIVNASPEAVPLHLSGHRFEVISTNGSDVLEPHVFRDTVTVNPSDRVELEFTADNPGVWSLASELMTQASNQGHFPGGIACVVRYSGVAGGN